MISIISASMPELNIKDFVQNGSNYIEEDRHNILSGIERYYHALIERINAIINELCARVQDCQDYIIIKYLIHGYVTNEIISEQLNCICAAFAEIFPETNINDFIHCVCAAFAEISPETNIDRGKDVIFWFSCYYVLVKNMSNAIPAAIIGRSIILVSNNNSNFALSVGRNYYVWDSVIVINNKALYGITLMHKRYPENEQVTRLHNVALAMVGKFLEDNEEIANALSKIEMHMTVICHGLDANQDTHDGNSFLEVLCNAFHFFWASIFCLFNKKLPQEVTKQYSCDRKSIEDQQKKNVDPTLSQNEDEIETVSLSDEVM
jgi:hypothetical protein